MAFALITAESIFHRRGSRVQALNPVLCFLSRDPCLPPPCKGLPAPPLWLAPPFFVHPSAPFSPHREQQDECNLVLFVEAAVV